LDRAKQMTVCLINEYIITYLLGIRQYFFNFFIIFCQQLKFIAHRTLSVTSKLS